MRPDQPTAQHDTAQGGSGSVTGPAVLGQAITGQRGYVAGASVLGAAHQGCEALVPVVIGVVIDQAVATGSVAALSGWIGLLAVLFVVLSYCFRFFLRAAERAAEQAAHALRLRLSSRVLHPRGGAEAGRLPGALVNIATGDAKRVGAVASALPLGIAVLSGLVISAIALLRISIPLGLLVLVGTPPMLYLAHLVGKPLERRSGIEQERAAHASGVAADLVAGLRVLKGIGAESSAVARYRTTSQDSLAAALRAARGRAWHDGTVLTLSGLFIAVVALVGANLALEGAISIGGLVAAVGLAQFLLEPFQTLTFVSGEYAQGRASARRVAEVLATAPAVTQGTGRLGDTTSGQLRVRGLSHGVLRDVRLDVPAGGVIGVASVDPAAATDLLACLARDVDPAQGAVELDGLDIATLDPSEARRAILVAAHDADLFEDSLLNNVAPTGSPLTDRALTSAAADDVAQALPEGAHTVLAERGRSLSGGQRQRVALARALAADPPVLVLHEPTTAIDPVTESRIAKGIAEVREGRSTIMVTTSPALLAVTDHVYLIDGGAVVADGRHADLAHDNADYRAAVLT